jgi:hypothetical protein
MEQITLLINRTDITPYCQVAIHSREDEMLQSHILASQLVDVKGALGNALFTDLIANRLEIKYVTLLDGGTYVNDDGYTISFQGLKSVIACFSYARYMLSKNAVDTPFGMVAKTSEYSEKADAGIITSIASAKRNEGSAYLQECIQFIKDNIDDYPLFENGCYRKPTSKFIHKITQATRF